MWCFCDYNVGMKGRPKKEKGTQRENTLRIRLTDDERKKLDDAAGAETLDTSTWARMILIRVATKTPREKIDAG
jgi:uncharacterized protein (DUF1778 family)